MLEEIYRWLGLHSVAWFIVLAIAKSKYKYSYRRGGNEAEWRIYKIFIWAVLSAIFLAEMILDIIIPTDIGSFFWDSFSMVICALAMLVAYKNK